MEDKIPDNPAERCPTCQGRFWSFRLYRWINRRETVGLVCQTCGKDYSEPDTKD